MREVWYCWKELEAVEGEDEPRLLTPWADPHVHEFAFDFLYETPKGAYQGASDMGAEPADDGWVLCKMVLEPVSRVMFDPDMENDDGKGWCVDDGPEPGGIVARFETREEAIAEAGRWGADKE